MYNQRDIVLVKFPFTDLANSKLRPALIISNEKINNTRDYIFMMITSSTLSSNFIELENSMLVTPFKPKNGVPKKSYLYGKKISTLDEKLIK